MGLPNPSHETKFSGANADREIFIFPVQLTTCRIGNLTRLIHTLAVCVTIHTIYHEYVRYQQYSCCLKKNLNASRPSEHPPVRGKKMSKRLGGIKDCKDKTSSWHLNGFPDGSKLGQQYNVGEKLTVILYTY